MKIKLKIMLFASALMLGFSGAATADVVKVWGQGNYSPPVGPIVSDFYDSLEGHSSSLFTGLLDSGDLTGVNLLWVIQPLSPLTADELNILANFLAGGGRIAFMGEHGGGLAVTENNNISAAVAALGGHMIIQNDNATDGGFHIATKANGQILDHPLTIGVESYEYAAFAPLIITTPPAEKLMLGIDLTSVMMAFENIGPGSIFMITDQNVTNFGGSVDNDQLFENLLTGETGAIAEEVEPVPTLSFWALLALISLIGLTLLANRKRLS